MSVLVMAEPTLSTPRKPARTVPVAGRGRPEVTHQGPLLLGGGGGQHVRAGLRGQLDDLVTDPTRGADDQHPVVGLELGGVHRRDRGGPGQPQRGALDEVDRVGQGGKAHRGRLIHLSKPRDSD
jgi:hypothetical protein